ncbi:hypothetical protein [Streptomyces sp. ADI96-02]|uniref:hypothetical protein n=1 Tax=Streptomyces sp. ADI96-02 TaxID=1522760 RepID=UPI000F555B7C|nr:hypothetical protein [Streptomyces sp. ADI96-02]
MTFPQGNFTITNNLTGLSLRAKLSESKDVGQHREGNKHVQTMTAPPALELAENDGSIEFAWYFQTAEDPDGRVPYNQIVSLAVRDLQNIGNFCLTLAAGEPGTEAGSSPLAAAFSHLTEERRKEFDKLIPKQWRGNRNKWYDTCRRLEDEGEPGIHSRHKGTDTLPWPKSAADLIPYLREYIAAVTESPEAPAPVYPHAELDLRGCGASRGKGVTYRWDTEGTYILGADSVTVPAPSTYWTMNSEGRLFVLPKGHDGQEWTISAWKA